MTWRAPHTPRIHSHSEKQRGRSIIFALSIFEILSLTNEAGCCGLFSAPFGKRSWKMFYCTLRDLVLYLHKDEHGFRKNQVRKLCPFLKSFLNFYKISRCQIMYIMQFVFIMHWPLKRPTTLRSSTCSGCIRPINPSICFKQVIQRSCNLGSTQSTMCAHRSRHRLWRVPSAAKNDSSGHCCPAHTPNCQW